MTVSRMPSEPHVIRLAGIWEITRSSAETTASQRAPFDDDRSIEWTRVRLDRLEADGLPFAPVAFRRFFNRPTNLVDGQPVFLEWLGLSQAAVIQMNGVVVAELAGGAEFVRLRIDDRLVERNEVTLVTKRCERIDADAKSPSQACWPFRECRLAIYEIVREAQK